MFKKILFCSLFILIFLITLKQDLNAKTWKNCKVPADSIIAAIDRGDSIKIDGCEIFGALIKRGTSEKPEIIKRHIAIWSSTFSDSISFRHCHFLRHTSFLKDHFLTLVEFDYSTFAEDVYFSGTIFDSTVSFDNVNFLGYADFMSTIFHNTVHMERAIFRKYCIFDHANFNGDVYFWETTFDSTISFAQRNCVIGFVDQGTTFYSFDDAFNRYPGGMFLSIGHSAGEITFSKNVDLTGMRFKDIEISWNQLDGHIICDIYTSYKLMKNFEEKRQLDDADEIYLFLKDQERMEKPWYVRYPEYWFIQLTCGYGVKPLNTLYLSIVIVLLFAFVYTLRFNSIKEIDKEFRQPRRPRILRTVRSSFRKRLYDAFYFSVHTFIIGVVSDWHPTDEFLIKTRRIKLFKFRTLSMIEGVLGWVLLVLFVVTLTRKFIR